MPLSAHARRQLKMGLANAEAADDIADIVDAGSGTISNHSKRHLVIATGDRRAANLIETAVNDGTALNGYAQRHLALAIGDHGAAQEIATALAAE